jgi:hypothetical protein
MKGRASEFAWWVPDNGFQLVSAGRARHRGLKYHPGLIYLRIAGSTVATDLCIPPEVASQSLRRYLEDLRWTPLSRPKKCLP